MKMIAAARAMGVSLALVLVGVFAHAAVSPYWQSRSPGVTGAWLGDDTFNINGIWRAYTFDSGKSFTSAISASQTATQAGCTQLSADAFQQVTTSAATGSVCLPTAVAGKTTTIVMTPAQTLDIFSSATSYVSGTQDTINGTAGTSAYTSNTGSNKTTTCFAVANGAWNCVTGS